MTQALALSMLQTGIQSVLPAGRALPEFDMSMAMAPSLTPTPVSTPIVTDADLDAAANVALHYAPAKMTVPYAGTAKPALPARISVEAAPLLAANEATGEVVSAETAVAPSTPGNFVRPKMADAVVSEATMPEQKTEQGVLPEDNAPSSRVKPEALLSDEDKQLADTQTSVARPEEARAPASASAMPTAVIIAHPLAEKAVVQASTRAGWTRARGEGSKIDAGMDATLSPAKPREVPSERQMQIVQTTKSAKEDSAVTTAQSLAIEAPAKSVAFESTLAFSNSLASSSDIRSITVQPAYGLSELFSAQGVADRHLDLALDSLWLDQLATDIVSVADQTDHISFRLMPAHLGQLDVDLFTSDAGLSVNIATSTEEAGQIVSAQQPGLIDSLQAQGIRVADTQVTSGGNDMSRQNQSQRQNAAHHLVETAFNGADEPAEPNDERPDGRFA